METVVSPKGETAVSPGEGETALRDAAQSGLQEVGAGGGLTDGEAAAAALYEEVLREEPGASTYHVCDNLPRNVCGSTCHEIALLVCWARCVLLAPPHSFLIPKVDEVVPQIQHVSLKIASQPN